MAANLLPEPCVHPSTSLRANGSGAKFVEDFPFVLSPSKHDK